MHPIKTKKEGKRKRSKKDPEFRSPRLFLESQNLGQPRSNKHKFTKLILQQIKELDSYEKRKRKMNLAPIANLRDESVVQ